MDPNNSVIKRLLCMLSLLIRNSRIMKRDISLWKLCFLIFCFFFFFFFFFWLFRLRKIHGWNHLRRVYQKYPFLGLKWPELVHNADLLILYDQTANFSADSAVLAVLLLVPKIIICLQGRDSRYSLVLTFHQLQFSPYLYGAPVGQQVL